MVQRNAFVITMMDLLVHIFLKLLWEDCADVHWVRYDTDQVGRV